jgi:hypothetical protein
MFGASTLMAVYALSTIGAGLSFDKFTKHSLTVGSSGGNFGLFGYLTVYHIRSGDMKAAKSLVMRIVRICLYNLMLYGGAGSSFKSNAINIGGFLTGALVSLLTGPRFQSTKLSPTASVYNVNEEARKKKPLIPLAALGIAMIAFNLLYVREALVQLPVAFFMHMFFPVLLSIGLSPSKILRFISNRFFPI